MISTPSAHQHDLAVHRRHAAGTIAPPRCAQVLVADWVEVVIGVPLAEAAERHLRASRIECDGRRLVLGEGRIEADGEGARRRVECLAAPADDREVERGMDVARDALRLARVEEEAPAEGGRGGRRRAGELSVQVRLQIRLRAEG